MRDPARKEQTGPRQAQVFGRKRKIRQVLAKVVQRHDHDDDAAQQVDRLQARRADRVLRAGCC